MALPWKQIPTRWPNLQSMQMIPMSMMMLAVEDAVLLRLVVSMMQMTTMATKQKPSRDAELNLSRCVMSMKTMLMQNHLNFLM